MCSSAAPIDDAILRTIAERARTHSLIETVRTERTDGMLSMVVAVLDLDRYPPDIREARLEIQWYTNGDYNFHYVERSLLLSVTTASFYKI